MEPNAAILIAANGAAAAALGLVLGLSWADWRTRRRVWLSDPERLLAAPPPREGLHALALGLAGGAGLVAMVAHGDGLAPSAVLLSAYAALGVATRRGWRAADTVGIGLVGGFVVSLLAALGWTGRLGALFPLALASGFLLWLARFWDQQLLDGQAWTTTGRLVPLARAWSWVGCLLAGGVGLAAHAKAAGDRLSWLGLALTVLALAGLAALQLADAARRPRAARAAGVAAAAAAGVAATAPLRAGLGW